MGANELEDVEGIVAALPFDDAEENSSLLVISKMGGYGRVSPSARFLLRWVKAGRTFEELTQELRVRQGRQVPPEKLRVAFERLIDDLERLDRRAGVEGLPLSYWFRIQLIPKEVVTVVAGFCSALFRPAFVLSFILAMTLIMVYAVGNGFSLSFDSTAFWPAYALFTISLMLHEFGHASACARFGAAPSSIGFVMYLMFPSFYSDVTAAWRLKRGQRVVVDLGGNYFQYIAGLLYVAAFLATGEGAFRLAFVMIIYASAFSLNPIFKFDGYWILADSLGVANLSQQPSRILHRILAVMKGQPRNPLPWSHGVVVSLVVYSLATTGVWTLLVVRLLLWLWSTTLGYPSVILATLEAVSSPGDEPYWSTLQQLVTSTAILVAAYVVAFRLLGAVIGRLKSRHVLAPR